MKLKNIIHLLYKKYSNVEKKCINVIKNNYKFVIINVLFGFFVYYMFISHDLINDVDGLWNLSNYYAYNWEIAIGRWGLAVTDIIFNGVVSISLRTIVAIFLVTIANMLTLKILGIKNTYMRYILSFIIIASPIVSTTLTYSYTAVGYFVSYLLSTLAVYVLEFSTYKGKYLLSAFIIALMLSFYQAYIDVVCVLIVFLIIKKIIEGMSTKNILLYIFKAICTALIAALFYRLMLSVVIYITGIHLAEYRNLTNISFSFIFKNLKNSILMCYNSWKYVFNEKRLFLDTSYTGFMLLILYILGAICLLSETLKVCKKNWINTIILLFFICIMPIACNIALVLAPGNESYNLTDMGMFYIIFFVAMLYSISPKRDFWFNRIVSLFWFSFLWISIIVVSNDQISLYEGRNSTITIAQNITFDLNKLGYSIEEMPLAIIGKPSKNKLYKFNPAMKYSNNYAQFGDGWGWNGNYSDQSWNGIYSYFLGFNMISASSEMFDSILKSDWIKDMPSYPSYGSITLIDDTIVVKISEDFN